MIGSIAGVTLLAATATGVLAYQALSGGGTQPDVAVPDTAVVYARLDLDPTAAQKVNLLRLLNRVPQLKEQGLDENTDIREQIFKEFTDNPDCNLDYSTDVKPWIGDRAAVAMVPGDGAPQPMLSIQVRDDKAARDAMTKVSGCNGGQSGVAFVDDYMVVAETEASATSIADQAKTAPLTKDPQYSADMAALGDTGFASFWFEGAGAAEALRSSGLEDASTNEQALASLDKVATMYGTVRAGSDYIELALQVSNVTRAPDTPFHIGDLPADTLFAAGFSSSPDSVNDMWGKLIARDPTMQDSVDQLEQSTGLNLPADLETLFGSGVVMAINGTGLDPSVTQTGDLSSVNVGLRLSGDSAAQNAVIDKFDTALTQSGAGLTLARQNVADGVVVATNPSYAQTLASDSSLGKQDGFTTVVPNADRADSAMYLNLDQASPLIQRFSPPGQSAEADELVRAIEPLKAFGMAMFPAEDGRASVVVRVVFN